MHPLHEEDVISPYDSSADLNSVGKDLYRKGQEVLRSGKSLGVVILSGGQGSRLGITYPKGLFVIEGKTLFEWHLSRLEEIHREYSTPIYLFIMTSDSTHDAVSEFFSKQSYSFLAAPVEIFKQSNLVAKSIESGEPLSLGRAPVMLPNGNGDFYSAIRQAPSRDAVDSFNVISVDNVLAHVLDEVYVGAFYSGNLDVLSKAVTANEGENVGAFFRDGSNILVREYSETASDAGKCPLGNICNHFFSASFVRRAGTENLPLHDAKKAISYTDSSGKTVVPTSPNGIKQEKFIFDAFSLTTRNQVMVVPRDHEFSPLKNSLESASDNVRTCTESIKRSRSKKRSLSIK